MGGEFVGGNWHMICAGTGCNLGKHGLSSHTF